MAGGTPTLQEVLADTHRSERLEIHTAMAGKIVDYSRAKHRATVLPQVKSAIAKDDESTLLEERPPIPNVPVAWPGGGAADGDGGENGFYLEFPLVKGNQGVLLFSEEAWGHFMETGQISPPGDLTRHSMGYCCFLPCQISNTGAFDDGGQQGLIIVKPERHLEIRHAGGTCDWVVTVDRLKQAFSDAITTALTSVVPNDGGLAVLTALKAQIEAMTVDTLGSNELKAGFG